MTTFPLDRDSELIDVIELPLAVADGGLSLHSHRRHLHTAAVIPFNHKLSDVIVQVRFNPSKAVLLSPMN